MNIDSPINVDSPRRRSSRRRRDNLTLLSMLLPSALILIAVFLIPIIVSLWTSLQTSASTPLTGNSVSLQNYQAVLGSSEFWDALKISIVFTIGSVLGSYVLGLVVAMLVYKRVAGTKALQALSVLPWATPYVAAALLWSSIFEYQYGPLNWLLTDVGVTANPVGWLTDTQFALPSVIFVQVWKMFPLASVMLLAGLQAISPDLLEAASLDGASGRQQFRYVLLPGLRPVTTAVVLLTTIWVFGRSFTVIYVLTGGGPVNATQTLVLQTFKAGFELFDQQTASTLGALILLVSGALTGLYWKFVYKDSKDGL